MKLISIRGKVEKGLTIIVIVETSSIGPGVPPWPPAEVVNRIRRAHPWINCIVVRWVFYGETGIHALPGTPCMEHSPCQPIIEDLGRTGLDRWCPECIPA